MRIVLYVQAHIMYTDMRSIRSEVVAALELTSRALPSPSTLIVGEFLVSLDGGGGFSWSEYSRCSSLSGVVVQVGSDEDQGVGLSSVSDESDDRDFTRG